MVQGKGIRRLRHSKKEEGRRINLLLGFSRWARRLWSSYRKIWVRPFFSADPVRLSHHLLLIIFVCRCINLVAAEVERQKPNPQQHLLALYGLGPLLRSVARTDPRTGEKINKLRKSYEGQIKSFGLAGRNKPVKGDRNIEEDQPGPLRRMAGSSAWGLQPDEQWNETHAKSKIEVTPDFKAKLRQAMQMQPGTVRNNAHWEDVLGFDKPKPNPLPLQQPITQPAPSRLGNGIVRPASQPSGEAKRQTRGKKRSYGDDSFVGYGEGYSDGEDGGDADDFGGLRKRKKVTRMDSRESTRS